MPTSPAAPSTPPLRTPTLLLLGLVACLTFIPFIPALTAGFVAFDDPGILKDVEGYKGLSAANLRWMFTTTQMGHYQPLTWLSYALDYAAWGRDPRGEWGLNPAAFHTTNIILHCLNAALVFLLARRLLLVAWASPPMPNSPDSPSLSHSPSPLTLDLAAAAAALLFSIHPLRVESVAWVTERRDVLSSFFLLLAALAYLRAFPAHATTPASNGSYAASIALLLISLLCKAWGMTFFVVLLILDWYPLGRLPANPLHWLRRPARSVLLQKAPYLALGLGAALMADRAQSSILFNLPSLEQWGIGARIAQAMYGLKFYVERTIWPTRLACIYELPRVFHPLEPRFIAAYAFTSAAAVAAIALWKKYPALTAAAAAYTITLGPILGFHQSGPQMVADRYSYLANIGWIILLAGVAAAWPRRVGRQAAIPIAIAALATFAALGARTWDQTRYWRDSAALFKHAIDTGSDGPIAREFYGRQLSERKQLDAALVQFQKGIDLDPGYAECWFSQANTLRDLGRYKEAEESFINAGRLMADSWRAHLLLGVMYLDKLDRPKDAETCFRAAIANAESLHMDPPPGRPYLMLAAALDIQGNESAARAALERAAQFSDVREEALAHLKEMNAPAPK